MFQTFGGTGNNIEGMAQKTSVITEINNIKGGISIALRSKDIEVNSILGQTTTLLDLAEKEYFDININKQLIDNNSTIYNGISFGSDGSLLMFLVLPEISNENGPGISITVAEGLNETKGFLESQIAKDLEPIANIDKGLELTDKQFTVYYKDYQRKIYTNKRFV